MANSFTDGNNRGTTLGYDGTTIRNVLVDTTGRLITTTGSATPPIPAATATLANIADTNVSTTLQAANTARLGWTCFNDSDQILYVKFGTTASTTSFTVKMAAGSYYELPTTAVYTGRIDGIWAADSTGSARVTELTA